MRVRWTRRAHQQLDGALTYIAQENPQAAELIAQRLYDAERVLASNPTVGRPGRVTGTREWVINGAPYLIGYTLQENELVIVALLHSMQEWPTQLDWRHETLCMGAYGPSHFTKDISPATVIASVSCGSRVRILDSQLERLLFQGRPFNKPGASGSSRPGAFSRRSLSQVSSRVSRDDSAAGLHNGIGAQRSRARGNNGKRGEACFLSHRTRQGILAGRQRLQGECLAPLLGAESDVAGN